MAAKFGSTAWVTYVRTYVRTYKLLTETCPDEVRIIKGSFRLYIYDVSKGRSFYVEGHAWAL